MQVKDTDVKRAIKALLSIQKEESLIEKEEYILVQFSLRRMDNKKRVKPIPIQIANPIYAQAQTCLITKDPQRKYKDLILQHNVKNIAKVVGIQKLKTKFKSYEEKRALCDSYDLFIADERVIEILPRLLGKAFFKKNKHPVACRIEKDINMVEKIFNSTFLHLTLGTCCTVKAATVKMPSEKIMENVIQVIEGAAVKMYGGWDNIQAIHLKTTSSAALPIYANIIQ